MYNTIIFDVDGTMIDTRPGIINSVKYVIDKYNLKKLTDIEFNKFVGLSPIQAAFSYFCETDEEFSQKCAEEYRNKYKQGDVLNAKLYDGIIELLEFLKNKNYKLGIATYKRQDNINEIAKHFKLFKYFDTICGADNENKLKKSDIILKCLQELNSDINTAIMIGDSCHDAEAAKSLGINFIGVTYGFGFSMEESIKQYNPIFVANNVHDIIKFFKTNKILKEV